MSTNPQFMFDVGSPNAFLSHEAIPAIEKRTGVRFEYVPILLGGIFKATNNKSPAESLAGVKNKREFHQIETGDLFGDGMFHLQAGVHFKKVKIVVRINQKFHCSGVGIAACARKAHRCVAHAFAQFRRHDG